MGLAVINLSPQSMTFHVLDAGLATGGGQLVPAPTKIVNRIDQIKEGATN